MCRWDFEFPRMCPPSMASIWVFSANMTAFDVWILLFELDAKPRLIFIMLFLGFSGASTFCRSRDHFPKEWHYSAIRRIAYPDKWVHRPAPKLEREPRHVRTLSIASGRGIVGNSAAFISGSNIAALLQFRIYLIQDAYILEYCLVKELRVSLWLSEQPF